LGIENQILINEGFTDLQKALPFFICSACSKGELLALRILGKALFKWVS